MAHEAEVFCKFGGIAIVKASVLSTTRIVCESPQDLSSGYNNVEVSLNGADYTTNGVQFSVVALPEVMSVYPTGGSEDGNTTLTISGEHFLDTDDLCCIFSPTLSVPATWIAPSAITCVTPPHPPQQRMLTVSTNGQQPSLSSALYAFQERVAVTKLLPSKGSMFGNTKVQVFGIGFLNSSTLSCKFGKVVVRGVFVTSTHIDCFSPAHEVSHVNFAVSNNKVDYTLSGVSYEYLSAAAVVSVYPRSGPTSGGTQV
eukprot:Stramenopile-MAST_4_protein_6027